MLFIFLSRDGRHDVAETRRLRTATTTAAMAAAMKIARKTYPTVAATALSSSTPLAEPLLPASTSKMSVAAVSVFVGTSAVSEGASLPSSSPAPEPDSESSAVDGSLGE